ncbi:MAG TPA: KpsF/GutQ family sugar-phosphate isomerase [Phycisphaerales bacterium]|nr:KpsF/GutQ family sugar-phosphate isomerase [Phycisphaerales bacterium]HMP37863.1 KpsF/GutQ family sugar-phosphate isomerase [Phycisphaerales bacterium]
MTTSPAAARSTADETTFLAEALRAEAEGVLRIADRIERSELPGVHRAVDLIARCEGHVVVSGMGKSGLIGQKISATLSSLRQPSHTLHPAEAMHGDLGRIRRGDVALLLSYSGETEELVALASILRADGVPRVGISRSDESTLARLCDAHVGLGSIEEACPLNLAPTASTTVMLAVGDALALAVARRRNFAADDFHRNHPGGLLGAELRPIVDVLRFRVGANLPVVRDDISVLDALRCAGGGRRAGAVMLVDSEGRLSGIFTDGDLRRLIGDDPGRIHEPVATAMTPRPQHLWVDDLVRDAVRLVRERRVDEIPVLDRDGRPVGLVDVQDLIAMKVVSE